MRRIAHTIIEPAEDLDKVSCQKSFVATFRRAPVHVARWGTFVITPKITDEKAAVSVKTGIAKQSSQEATVAIQTSRGYC